MNQDAYKKALGILALSDHSTKMLKEKLRKSGYEQQDVDSAVERLVKEGYVNDKRLFFSYVSYLAEKKHFGAMRINISVREKFYKETVEEYLNEALSEQDFAGNAMEYAEKHKAKGKDYMIRRLKYLGHRTNYIITVINEVFGREETDE